jgi:hypothetical protein
MGMAKMTLLKKVNGKMEESRSHYLILLILIVIRVEWFQLFFNFLSFIFFVFFRISGNFHTIPLSCIFGWLYLSPTHIFPVSP